MAFTSLTDLSASQKAELVASLSAMVAGDDATSESLVAIAEASGNSIDASMATLFASVVSSAGGLKNFCAIPGSGGGGGGSPAAGGAAAEAAAPEPEEEEEEAPMGGGDMFGAGGGGGDY